MNDHDKQPITPIPSHHALSDELRAIYINTFATIGKEFLTLLMKEITIQVKLQSTLLLQLLSYEEYKELSTLYKEDSHFKLIPSTTSSPEPSYSDDTFDYYKDQYLLIRSSYSIAPNPYQSNTVIPLSSLDPSSPFRKALFNTNPIYSVNQTIDDTFQHFISFRFDSPNDKLKGLLCVMDDHTIQPNTFHIITHILDTIQYRCINELVQIRREEQLIAAKNIASIDAENKLKFLADMSHEIRTPMNAVIALTDLLLQERSTLNIEQIEHLEVIQTSGSHLLTIINDILDISKLNHDPKFKLESRRFSLRKCLKDTLNMAKHQASMSQQNKLVCVLESTSEKDLPLTQMVAQLENNGILLKPLLEKNGQTVLPLLWKIDPDVPDYLLGDTMRLTQIMLNLCSNAVKFTKEGGIQIRIKKSVPTTSKTTVQNPDRRMTFKERYDAKIETMWNQARSSPLDDDIDYFGEKAILEVSVTDTGIGIPADRLPKLFKSFSQIDISTARRYGGTGLGLAISSTLVNRMGGCVWVESEEGVGSRFALTLPLTIAPRGKSSDMSLNFSPSSPSSTVSDSSSVHSTTLQNELLGMHNTPPFNFFPLTNTNSNLYLPRPRPSSMEPIDPPDVPTNRRNEIGPSTPRNRTSLNKPPYRKVPVKEENLAKIYPLRILLAEDNILNQKIAISILKRLGYTDVGIANNGSEVLKLMEQNVFDVIFMDLYMPEMDGLEVTREIIKEREKDKDKSSMLNSSDVYIIALTASASREDRQICIDAGMNDFISKPFTMTEMKSALKTCANNRKKKRKLGESEDDPMLDIQSTTE